MLFKNKRIVIEGDDGMAFETMRVGANICKLRKKLGITQTELADRMGISFQAVSNWECGNSMPDISKLGELSEILGASIDEILGNERIARIADAVLNDEPAKDVTGEELESIAPILKDEQVEKLLDREDAQTDDIASVAPFLSTGFIDDYARKKIAEGVHPERIMGIIPFMSDRAINELADTALKLHGLQAISSYIPFLSSSKVDRLAIEAYEKHKTLESLTSLLPFMSGSAIGSIAKQVLDKDGLRGIQPLLPFVDSSILEKFIREKE